MKTRLLLALVGLAISFAAPALAQEKAASPAVPNPFQPIPAGPALVQQLDVIDEKFDEAFNKHDASAVAAFYTSNAILSSPLGVASGLAEIEKYFTNLFERFSPTDRSTKMNYVYAFGRDLVALGGLDRHYYRPPTSRGLSSKCVYSRAQYLEDSCSNHGAGLAMTEGRRARGAFAFRLSHEVPARSRLS